MNDELILQYEPQILESDINAIKNYLLSGGFITEFKKTKEFEEQLSRFCGVKNTIIYPNGTLTLFAILKSLEIGKGHKVVVPNYTMAATAFSVKETGAEVIFCDIEWPSLCLCLDSLKQIIANNKSEISAVMHMAANGRYPMNYEIQDLLEVCEENSINLIEDSAQALGSFYKTGEHIGSLGCAGSLSFSMPKIITTGQGGAIISNNDNISYKLRKYKDFGRFGGGGTDEHETIGLNFKFTDLQASLGISQLKRIENIIKRKKENYQILKNSINSKYVNLIFNDLSYTTPWFYEVFTDYREKLIVWLKKNNILSRVMYPELNKQKAFENHPQKNYQFLNSKRISKKGLWIPSHPNLSGDQINMIAEIINSFNPKNIDL